jgi:hypothetical protein
VMETGEEGSQDTDRMEDSLEDSLGNQQSPAVGSLHIASSLHLELQVALKRDCHVCYSHTHLVAV